MARKLPLSRGWKRRVHSSFLSDVILNLHQSSTLLARPSWSVLRVRPTG